MFVYFSGSIIVWDSPDSREMSDLKIDLDVKIGNKGDDKKNKNKNKGGESVFTMHFLYLF